MHWHLKALEKWRRLLEFPLYQFYLKPSWQWFINNTFAGKVTFQKLQLNENPFPIKPEIRSRFVHSARGHKFFTCKDTSMNFQCLAHWINVIYFQTFWNILKTAVYYIIPPKKNQLMNLLFQVCSGKVKVVTVPGNHETFILGSKTGNVVDVMQPLIG